MTSFARTLEGVHRTVNQVPPLSPVFLLSADFFFKFIFLKSSFRNSIRVSNSLHPDYGPTFWVQTICKIYQQMTLGDIAVKILCR